MSGWMVIGNRYPFAYTEPPEILTLERTDHSERINYVPEHALLKENARLRSCLSDDAENAQQIIGENKQLLGLCRRFIEYVSFDRCEGCVVKSSCRNGLVDECWQLTEIRELASKLGLVVDE